MKRISSLSFFVLILLPLLTWGFLLIDRSYRLSKPTETVVNIGAGGCRANGISDGELRKAIEEAIEKYWNTVTESELRLSLGGEVNRSGTQAAQAGEILVYCAPLGASGPAGVTTPNLTNGSAVVRMNSDQFSAGNYSPGAFEGVLIHELGHGLGLHHSGDPASVMTYERHNWGPMPSFLSQDDRDGITFLYPRKGQVEGLVPGCSAVAASSPQARGSLGLTILGFFLEIGLLWAIWRGLKGLRT